MAHNNYCVILINKNMIRKVFYSFHFKEDDWRVNKIRGFGFFEYDNSLSDDYLTEMNNDDEKIKNWIDNQIKNKDCTIVMIGENTANRKWINYEIEKTFNTGKALFGIRIHNITDENNNKANKGDNPFDFVYFNGKKLSNYIKIYEPKGEDNKSILDDINHNLERLVDEAIEDTKNYQNI